MIPTEFLKVMNYLIMKSTTNAHAKEYAVDHNVDDKLGVE